MTPAEFHRRTAHVAYQPRGTFFSEIYLFASLCLAQGVTQIIESGVGAGVSTRLLRSLWPGRVTSIEFRPKTLPLDLEAIVIGDGCVLVPDLVTAHADDRLGVLLDGPKKVRGALLRDWCLTQPNVRVVAQHDSPQGRGEVAHSHDPAFRRDVGDAIDSRISTDIRALYAPLGCPGLGVWVNA